MNNMDQLLTISKIHDWYAKRHGEEAIMGMRLKGHYVCSSVLELEGAQFRVLIRNSGLRLTCTAKMTMLH
jgi:hypothetical protein